MHVFSLDSATTTGRSLPQILARVCKWRSKANLTISAPPVTEQGVSHHEIFFLHPDLHDALIDSAAAISLLISTPRLPDKMWRQMSDAIQRLLPSTRPIEIQPMNDGQANEYHIRVLGGRGSDAIDIKWSPAVIRDHLDAKPKQPPLSHRAVKVNDDLLEAYRPLDASRKEIRLIEGLNMLRDGRLSCRLKTVSLQDKPVFVALSYIWGDPTITQGMCVEGLDGRITTSLYHGLRHTIAFLKDPALLERMGNPSEVLIWADALCINQADILERNLQVKLMGQIYSSAIVVVSWLHGHFEDSQALAFDFLGKVADAFDACQGKVEGLYNLEWLKKYPIFQKMDDEAEQKDKSQGRKIAVRGRICFDALAKLCTHPYWVRVWIYQEVSLPETVYLLLPTRAFPLQVIAKGIYAMHELSKCGMILGADSEFAAALLLMQSIPEFTIQPVFDKFYIRQEILKKGAPESRRGFLSLTGYHTQATDPRDKVYGMLGLTALNVEPDYDKTVLEVYQDHARAIMESGQVDGTWLMFLTTVARGLSPEYPSYPSWLPCGANGTRVLHTAIDGLGASERACLDVFVGTDSNVPYISGNVLFAPGTHLQNVTHTCSLKAGVGAGDFKEMIEYVLSRGNKTRGGLSRLEALCHTVFGSDDIQKRLQSLTANLACFQDHKKKYPLLTKEMSAYLRMLKSQSRTQGAQSSIKSAGMACHMDWARELSARFNRNERLFETVDGYIGIAPEEVAIGDKLCVLNGLQVCALLRSVKDHHVFVGPTSVYGLHQGEAKFILQKGLAQLEVFEIR